MHLAWDLEAATVQDLVKNIALKSLEILPSNSGLNALHIRTNRKFETSRSTGHMHKHVFGYNISKDQNIFLPIFFYDIGMLCKYM